MIITDPIKVTNLVIDELMDGVFTKVLTAYTDGNGIVTTLFTGTSPNERIIINESGHPNTIRFYNPANKLVGSIYGGETIDNGQTFYGILTSGYAFSDTGFIGFDTAIIGTGGFNKVALQSLYTSSYHSSARMVFGFNLAPSLYGETWTTAGFGGLYNEGYGIVITGGHSNHSGDAGDWVFYTATNTGTFSSRVLTNEELYDFEIFRISKDSLVTSKYMALGTTGSLSYRLSLPSGTTSADGIIWGTDTVIYRKAANVLATDDLLALANAVTNPTTSAYGLTFGGASAGTPDVNLYRSAANNLKTDDTLTAVKLEALTGMSGFQTLLHLRNSDAFDNDTQGIVVTYELNAESGDFIALQEEVSFYDYAATAETSRWDVKLYNSGSQITSLSVIGDLFNFTSYVGIGIASTSSYRLRLPAGTTAGDGITWGTDTVLYRSAANNLKTDDGFHIKSYGETTWGSGLRFIRQSTSDYFDIQFGSSGQLIFGRNATQFGNIDTTGLWYINNNLQVVGDIYQDDVIYPYLTVSGSGGSTVDFTIKCRKFDGNDSANNRMLVHWWLTSSQWAAPSSSSISVTVTTGTQIHQAGITIQNGLNTTLTDSNETIVIRATSTGYGGSIYLHAEVQGILYVLSATISIA